MAFRNVKFVDKSGETQLRSVSFEETRLDILSVRKLNEPPLSFDLFLSNPLASTEAYAHYQKHTFSDGTFEYREA